MSHEITIGQSFLTALGIRSSCTPILIDVLNIAGLVWEVRSKFSYYRRWAWSSDRAASGDASKVRQRASSYSISYSAFPTGLEYITPNTSRLILPNGFNISMLFQQHFQHVVTCKDLIWPNHFFSYCTHAPIVYRVTLSKIVINFYFCSNIFVIMLV